MASLMASLDCMQVSISRSSGTLSDRHETHMITLDCSTQRLDIYSTYVVVENVDNPHDLKTIHVTMRMIVSADVPISHYFSVIVDTKVKYDQSKFGTSELAPGALRGPAGTAGAGAAEDAAKKELWKELRIDMGDVYYGMTYFNRSFVVQNQSSMPLDFVISHNLQSGPLATEVHFSLSNTALKVFSSLLVPPNASKRVFLHFCTSAPREPPTPNSSSLSTPGLATRLRVMKRELQMEISISCRLVKDHRKVIHLSAVCHPPQLALSHTELSFTMPPLNAKRLPSGKGLGHGGLGGLITPAPSLKVEPRAGTVQLASVGGGSPLPVPLRYAVRSSCTFFVVSAGVGANGEPDDAVVGANTPHTITVTPNERAIHANLSFLAKARYIEEHFTVYNLADLSEHKCVLLRLSCGQLQVGPTFSFTPSESTLGYSALEEDILRFQCAFSAFWDRQLGAVLGAALHAARARPLTLTTTLTPPAAADGTVFEGVAAAAAATPHLVGEVTFGVGGDGAAATAKAADAALGAGAGSVDASAIAADGDDGEAAGSSRDATRTATQMEAARQHAALLVMLEEVQLNPAYQKLWFDFRHITDELVFYGMGAQSPQLIAPHSNLFYKLLFRHEIFETFAGARDGATPGGSQPKQQRRLLPLGVELRAPLPPKLVLWVRQLSYFLMHFPDVEGGISPLRRLHRALLARRRADAEPRPKAGSELHDLTARGDSMVDR